MQTLYHKRLQGLEAFFDRVRLANSLYLGRNPDFPDAMAQLTKDLQPFFETEGLKELAAKASCYAGELETIRRGYHPVTFEKLETPKRDQQYALCFKITDALSNLLSTASQQATARLEQARELVENILLVAVQHKLIVTENLPDPLTQADLEAIWQGLDKQDALSIIQKKALLLVHLLDCLILMDEAFEKMKSRM